CRAGRRTADRRRRSGASPARAMPPPGAWWSRRGHRREALRELRRDPVVEGVGEDHDFGEDVVERLDIGGPVTGDPGDRLVLGELEMERQPGEELLPRAVRA